MPPKYPKAKSQAKVKIEKEEAARPASEEVLPLRSQGWSEVEKAKADLEKWKVWPTTGLDVGVRFEQLQMTKK